MSHDTTQIAAGCRNARAREVLAQRKRNSVGAIGMHRALDDGDDVVGSGGVVADRELATLAHPEHERRFVPEMPGPAAAIDWHAAD